MKNKTKRRAETAEVNVTPMLDIVFIMLIFFIVTSTFIYEKGLDVTRQKESDNQENNDNAKAIMVAICRSGDISIDNRLVDIRSVRANLERKIASEPHNMVIIQSERQASTGSLVAVLDQAKAAKAQVSISATYTSCGDGKNIALNF